MGYAKHAPGLAEMAGWLRLDNWGRQVPTVVLAGEVDPLITLQDLRELYEKLPPPKRFASLRGAGHWHFNDDAEAGHETFRHMYLTSFPDDSFDTRALGVAMRPFSELCPAEHAADTQRGLCLAHMDAHLRDNQDARAVLDIPDTLAARGIELEVALPA